MRLMAFSTYGFKSFAEKTELTFDKGITAIVGPNGSGKSNISDAVRWVLGEQSAKYLRGSRMEDVIFSGSSRRRAMGVAEVTLTFDNSGRTLPLDFAEVSLTRRLFRSGDSEYAINKKNCRLKDVVDLLADTGLGKGSMSIIGQNKIDEILNGRPEERRALFEEAAGIAKFRLRRKEALRRLDETALNLTRINDIRLEVEGQVQPLCAAAAKTRLFNELKGQLRLCRLTGFMRKIDGIEAARARLNARKAALEAAYSEQAAGLSLLEAEYSRLQLELDKLNEDFLKLQDEARDTETALEKNRGAQNVLEERVLQHGRAMERLGQSNEKMYAQAEALEQKMQELAAEFDALEKTRAAAELKVRNLAEARDAQEEALRRSREAADNTQSEFFSDMQELLRLRNDLRRLEQEQELRMRRRESLKRGIEETEAAAARLEENLRVTLAEESRNAYAKSLLDDEKISLQKEQGVLRQREKELHEQQQRCQRQLTASETREQSLQKMQDAYEGFGYGSKAVLRCGEPWRAGIIGAVAELLHVEDKYITAIETALGESAQNLVAANADAARQAIGFLKRSNAGRATFLPLDTLRSRALSPEEERLARLPGICGYAASLVEMAAGSERAIRFLLGRILIAENMDAALAAAKTSNFRIRAVTLDGDTVNAGGSMTGGSRKRREGYLSRAREIRQAAAEAAELRGQMLALQEQLEETESQLEAAAGRQAAVDAKLQRARMQSDNFHLQKQRIEQEKAQANDKLALLLDDRSAVTAEYMANRTEVEALRTKVRELEAKDSEAKAMLEQLQRQVASQGSELAALENRLQDARVELETSSAKTEFMAERMHNLDADTLALRNDIKTNVLEQQRLQQAVAQCETEKAALAEKNALLVQELAQITGGRERFAERRLQLAASQRNTEERVADARKAVAAAENRLRQLELEMTRQNSDYNHALAQLAEEYHMDADTARQSELLELDGVALRRLESGLNARMEELGPVNPAAVEEYEAVRERSEFLNKQYDDLCRAKENLQKVISEISAGMTKKFREAFASINIYFAECYARLFGGGKALLKLSDAEDLLNSGIDIEAQPPGKKLQSLYLLSGGERALTVIALLFALLRYQPSPFCILDEIDAALDDANIVRFAGFLREYAEKTQFIIITHRKGTMECADIMYGVTMEESGVSKLLSVRMGEKE